jgi:hypothetical protein
MKAKPMPKEATNSLDCSAALDRRCPSDGTFPTINPSVFDLGDIVETETS